MYFKMTKAAITVAGGAAALCLGSVPAALAAPAQNTYFVACNPDALHTAIANAGARPDKNLASFIVESLHRKRDFCVGP